MKRKNPFSNSCSSSYSSSPSPSSSSSSCNQSSPKLSINDHPQQKKPKRVRTKEVLNLPQNSKSRSSIYRGVTRHRWTGRFEAHLWDKTTWNSVQNKKGKQIYLGAYDNEDDAARTYDLAALKYWGTATALNFPLDTYTKDIEEMLTLSKEECLASLRRRSSGFSRGISKYRGVARHHHNGKWEARIGNVSGNKYLYLGTYRTQEEAAVAYDMAAIEFRGPNAVTNFDINNYTNKLKTVLPENEEVQVKQEVPNFSDNASHESCEQDKDLVKQPRISKKLESIDSSIDLQAMFIMNNVEESENRHPWDLFLDSGINSSPILDIPIHNKLGFEENIEYIFDGSFHDYEFHWDEMSGANADVLVVGEGKGKDLSTCPSNSISSLSTTTTVCSNA